jgi:hypothetical protein
MSFTKAQIIHIVIEAILIVGLTTFVVLRTNQQSSKISELENELRMQKSRTDVLEAVVQEILKGQNQTVRQRVAHIARNVRPGGVQMPVQVQARPVQQREVQQAPPPPPNPIESMMSMMAPMMSALVIGGDDEPESQVEIREEHIDDSEIAEELNDLKGEDGVKSDGDAVVEEIQENSEDTKSGDKIDDEIDNEIAALEKNRDGEDGEDGEEDEEDGEEEDK